MPATGAAHDHLDLVSLVKGKSILAACQLLATRTLKDGFFLLGHVTLL
jgi:hypothetical protein